MSAEPADGAVEHRESHGLFEIYEPTLPGPPHPATLRQSTTQRYAMPALDPEDLHQTLRNVDELSAPQRDAVAMARSCMKRGEALLIGDATGVGKNRQIIGTFMNQAAFEGATHFVFVTASNMLKRNVELDIRALNWNGKVMEMPDDSKKRLPPRGGVVFVTYSMLCRKVGDRFRRVSQLVTWMRNKSAVIAFDEVHKAAGGQTGKMTATGEAVVQLQAGAAHAAVLYASATAVNSLSSFAVLPRLNLFGPKNAQFADFKAFRAHFRSRTMASLEIVSSDLAARGAYVARRLGLDGAEFESVVVELDEDGKRLHAQLCDFWAELFTIVGSCDSKLTGLLRSAALRCSKSFLVSMRIPAIVEACVAHVKKEGGACIVSMAGTDEAGAAREDAAAISEAGFVSLRQTLSTELKRVIAAALDPASLVPQSEMGRLDVIGRAMEGFKLPASPLDTLLHELREAGLETVEMSGRTHEVQPDYDGTWVRQKREYNNHDALLEFQKIGRADVAVVTAAASTGISLHDATENYESRRRLHVLLELQWSAAATLQTLGRTHRSDQCTAPKYLLPVSDLLAERRMSASVSSRMAALGASTASDRRGSTGGLALAGADLLGPSGQTGLNTAFNALCSAHQKTWPSWFSSEAEDHQPTAAEWEMAQDRMSKTLKEVGCNPMDVGFLEPRQVLNALLIAPISESNEVFQLLEAAVASLTLDQECGGGKRDESVSDVKAGVDVHFDEADASTGLMSTALGGRLRRFVEDVGLDFQTAREMLANDESSRGFFTQVTSGEKQVRRTVAVTSSGGFFVKMTRPSGRVLTCVLAELRKRGYNLVAEEADARAWWDAEYTNADHSEVGGRRVGGALVRLPALDLMPSYLSDCSLVRLREGDARSLCVRVPLYAAAQIQSRLEKAAASAAAVGGGLANVNPKSTTASRPANTAAVVSEEEEDEEEAKGEQAKAGATKINAAVTSAAAGGSVEEEEEGGDNNEDSEEDDGESGVSNKKSEMSESDSMEMSGEEEEEAETSDNESEDDPPMRETKSRAPPRGGGVKQAAPTAQQPTSEATKPPPPKAATPAPETAPAPAPAVAGAAASKAASKATSKTAAAPKPPKRPCPSPSPSSASTATISGLFCVDADVFRGRVKKMRHELNIQPGTSLVDAVNSANERFGLAAEGTLQQQVQRIDGMLE